MKRLYIIVPAYNESENIETFINDWYPIIETYNAKNQSRLVIINDGSKDNTLEILKKMCRRQTSFNSLRQTKRRTWLDIAFGISICYRK